MPALSGGMILYSRRSAKSVACSRLNVIGVSAFFFFPAFVATLTSADEFQSVTKTLRPLAASHLASRPSCVVFPEPSMPSTTNRRPGYVCGELSVLSIGDLGRDRAAPGTAGGRREFEANGTVDFRHEGPRVTFRGPEFELGVAPGADADDQVRVILPDPAPVDDLRMAAIEALGQAQQGRKHAHYPAARSVQLKIPCASS